MKRDVDRFWKWVDTRMEELDITSLRELERRAGFAPGAVGKRWNMLKPPTVEMAEGLCRALRVSWCELWEQAGFVDHVTEEDLRGEEAEIHRELEGMPERSKRRVLKLIRLYKAWLVEDRTEPLPERFSVNEPGTEYDTE